MASPAPARLLLTCLGIGMAVPQFRNLNSTSIADAVADALAFRIGGGAWGLDTTTKRPKTDFVRMGKTYVTKQPIDLSWGTTSAPPSDDAQEPSSVGDVADAYVGGFATIGKNIGGAETSNSLPSGKSIWLNDFTGRAHAHCYSLAVEGEDEHNFRVCNAMEMQAVTALVTIPLGRRIMTFASSDGDDYDTGQTWFKMKKDDGPVELDSYGSYSSYSYSYEDWTYDWALDTAGAWAMQVFQGPDKENNMNVIDQGLMAYCCSSAYTKYNGEGPSRRRR
jgi:hypothetical protein